MNASAADPLQIDRQWIESHIPHQGRMCLLDRVDCWDANEIHCIARSHLHADNPLRSGDRLGIATAIEYAAQATAAHSALLIGDGEKLGAGFLASARNVRWYQPALDIKSTNGNDEIRVRATRLSGNDMTVLYAFEILSGMEKLIEGRVGIFLNSDAAASITNHFERLSP